MSTIPPDIYEHVSQLAFDITNATLADDHALAESLYQRLHLYHEEQLATGRSHPFILETLADYTDDPAPALRYYEKALEMSRLMTSDEPTHTILISIGERLLELKRAEQAEAFIRDGRTEAQRRGELEWVKEADELLTKLDGQL
ncbi:MAG: hypothetical protein K0Q55_100 [Verrucomicrobia bacterium]|jgi:hypothetical protein|nr:hypothetical protein [Verrucomicrobiota bacterium]